jgi:hypothetical protein
MLWSGAWEWRRGRGRCRCVYSCSGGRKLSYTA